MEALQTSAMSRRVLYVTLCTLALLVLTSQPETAATTSFLPVDDLAESYRPVPNALSRTSEAQRGFDSQTH
ncbi:hypothetical protein H4R33_001130 [Dimargaris cristalligena]|nr:hypothetical protein H4R33_001130 [Dimargaris cristalligena]